MIALTGLTEKEVSILRAYSACECDLIYSMEIFGEEIGTVLTLMIDATVKVSVGRAVTVGRVRETGCQARCVPVLYIVRLYAIGLIAVADMGMYIRERLRDSPDTFNIVGICIARKERTAEIHYKSLLPAEMLF